MHIRNRDRAKLILAAGLVGMGAQEALSMMPGSILKSAALLILAFSVGLLLLGQSAAFRAGYEEARRGPPLPHDF